MSKELFYFEPGQVMSKEETREILSGYGINDLKGKKAVVMALLLYISGIEKKDEEGYFFVTNQWLMEHAGIKSKSTFSIAINCLKAKNYIERVPGERTKEHPDGWASMYRIPTNFKGSIQGFDFEKQGFENYQFQGFDFEINTLMTKLSVLVKLFVFTEAEHEFIVNSIKNLEKTKIEPQIHNHNQIQKENNNINNITGDITSNKLNKLNKNKTSNILGNYTGDITGNLPAHASVHVQSQLEPEMPPKCEPPYSFFNYSSSVTKKLPECEPHEPSLILSQLETEESPEMPPECSFFNYSRLTESNHEVGNTPAGETDIDSMDDDQLVRYYDELFRPKTTKDETEGLLLKLPRDYAHLTNDLVREISAWSSYLEGAERQAFDDIIDERLGAGSLERIRRRAINLIRG